MFKIKDRSWQKKSILTFRIMSEYWQHQCSSHEDFLLWAVSCVQTAHANWEERFWLVRSHVDSKMIWWKTCRSILMAVKFVCQCLAQNSSLATVTGWYTVMEPLQRQSLATIRFHGLYKCENEQTKGLTDSGVHHLWCTKHIVFVFYLEKISSLFFII